MVLVTGGTGCLGSRVSRVLLAENRPVRVLTRSGVKAAPLECLGADVMVGDLRDRASLARACQDVEYVVAAAHAVNGSGRSNPRTVDDAGNRSLIDAALAQRVKHFVFVSAAGADPQHPLEPFRIKHAVERYLQASGLSFTVLRPTAFMEPWAGMVGDPIMRRGRTLILGRGDHPINLIALDDVAHYVLVALFNPDARNRVIEVGGPQNLTAIEMAETFERVSGERGRRTHLPLRLLHVLCTLITPFSAGASRVLAERLCLSTCARPFDPDALLAEFPRRLVTLEEMARQRCRARGQQPSLHAS